jgi:hypothetical protein
METIAVDDDGIPLMDDSGRLASCQGGKLGAGRTKRILCYGKGR